MKREQEILVLSLDLLCLNHKKISILHHKRQTKNNYMLQLQEVEKKLTQQILTWTTQHLCMKKSHPLTGTTTKSQSICSSDNVLSRV